MFVQINLLSTCAISCGYGIEKKNLHNLFHIEQIEVCTYSVNNSFMYTL